MSSPSHCHEINHSAPSPGRGRRLNATGQFMDVGLFSKFTPALAKSGLALGTMGAKLRKPPDVVCMNGGGRRRRRGLVGMRWPMPDRSPTALRKSSYLPLLALEILRVEPWQGLCRETSSQRNAGQFQASFAADLHLTPALLIPYLNCRFHCNASVLRQSVMAGRYDSYPFT